MFILFKQVYSIGMFFKKVMIATYKQMWNGTVFYGKHEYTEECFMLLRCLSKYTVMENFM